MLTKIQSEVAKILHSAGNALYIYSNGILRLPRPDCTLYRTLQGRSTSLYDLNIHYTVQCMYRVLQCVLSLKTGRENFKFGVVKAELTM